MNILDSEILPKEVFYEYGREERIRLITLWRILYSTNEIIECMGFKTKQAFYNMLTRIGVATSWANHKKQVLNNELNVGKQTQDFLKFALETYKDKSLDVIHSSDKVVDIAIKGSINVELLPKLMILAKEMKLSLDVVDHEEN